MLRLLLFIVLLEKVISADQWMYQSGGKWDKEWKSGAWEYLETNVIERSRIAVIGGVLVDMNAPKNASVLDVGCGEGAISDFLLPGQKANYVGVDISKEAIRIAKSKRKYPMKFVHGTAHQFNPTNKFDVIIFSEMLYYVDYKNVLSQYASYLTANGIIIISIFYSEKKMFYSEIWEYARNYFNKIEEIDISGYMKKTAKGPLQKTGLHMEVYTRKK